MATYETIASAIRERIETGALQPGDRVPSTRAITREWRVAIATATRALATLQAEGLVRGVVGVGTVVAERTPASGVRPQGTVGRQPARGAEPELTRDRVVRTAIVIADAEGIPAVTMRRLATELGVAVMSLYRYVPGKEELVTLMIDHVFGEVDPPSEASAHWRERIEAVMRLQWQLCTRHPWLPSATSLVRPPLVPNGMAFLEHNIRVARDLGFDPPTSLKIAVAMSGFLLGVGTSLQLEAEAERETGLSPEEFMRTQEDVFADIAQHRFPALFEASMTPDFDLPLDDVFEFGLGLMLDGLAQRLSSRRTPRRPPRAGS